MREGNAQISDRSLENLSQLLGLDFSSVKN
jgi:hypothetical protein